MLFNQNPLTKSGYTAYTLPLKSLPSLRKLLEFVLVY